MTLRSEKESKEPGKSREVEHEIEVNQLEPSKDQDITSNANEISENKKEPHMPLRPFPSRLKGQLLRWMRQTKRS